MVGIRPEDLDDRYPLKLASTGGWHLLVPVRTREAIDRAVPQYTELGAFNQARNITTTHLFTTDGFAGYDLYTRDFAPAIGIPEDPVTGAANGALSGYLALEGFLQKGQVHRLVVGQGHAIGRDGTLYVTVETTGEKPVIRVGGAAHVTIAGQLRLREQ